MGMAASQARFLGLTARKTNTEYEGQQINQQRTTLANQSANYYNQLLGMTVPVPPSVADYTKTVYTFTDGALSNSISSMMAQKDGTYIISYTSTWTNDFAVVATNPVLYTRSTVKPTTSTDEYDYLVGAKRLRSLGTPIPRDSEGKYAGVPLTDGTVYYDEYLKTLSKDQLDALEKEETDCLNELNDKYGTPASGWEVRYVFNSSTNTWIPYFANKDILKSAKYSDTGTSQSALNTYTIGSAKETEEIKGVSARMEQDATGRIINITLKPGEPDEVTYAVATNSVTDQAKYEDAMNQYEYDKYEYEQSIQEINAKIEIIQSEDRNLELRLKQLDTEQEAIQTEMDAVQKVIEKNTESTFKTFG